MTNVKNKTNIKLNNSRVPEVNEYKYLGDMITIDNTYSKVIEDRRNSINGTVAELVSINNEIRHCEYLGAAIWARYI